MQPMAGRGPAPTEHRRSQSDVPIRGEYEATPGIGWQHGDIPAPPPKLVKASRDTWHTWMTSWYAAHWTPEDLPGLRQVIRIWDRVERGEFQRANEMRLQMDTYGITPKGQQDRRWRRPEAEVAAKAAKAPTSPYRKLRVVNE